MYGIFTIVVDHQGPVTLSMLPHPGKPRKIYLNKIKLQTMKVYPTEDQHFRSQGEGVFLLQERLVLPLRVAFFLVLTFIVHSFVLMFFFNFRQWKCIWCTQWISTIRRWRGNWWWVNTTPGWRRSRRSWGNILFLQDRLVLTLSVVVFLFCFFILQSFALIFLFNFRQWKSIWTQ